MKNFFIFPSFKLPNQNNNTKYYFISLILRFNLSQNLSYVIIVTLPTSSVYLSCILETSVYIFNSSKYTNSIYKYLLSIKISTISNKNK